LLSLSIKYGNFTYYINEENSGACVSRNKAINVAKGIFITGLDDDDYFYNNHILTCVKAWENKKNNIIALYPNQFDETTDGVKRRHPKPSECSASDLLTSNWIGNQIFTLTKSLKSIDGFDERFPAWQDYECWYRLLKSSGKKASCTDKYTYVLDAGHPHERISNGVEKGRVAWGLFVNKHCLDFKDAEMVKLMLVGYGAKDVNLKSLVRKILLVPSYKNIRNSLIIFYIFMARFRQK